LKAGRAGSSDRRSGRRRDGAHGARGRPVSIGPALSALVQDLGIAPTLRQYDVLTSWAEVVGEQIARVTTAQRIENGTLFVGVANGAWRNELSMKRLAIMEKLNRKAGAQVVKDIRFR